jgi:hypothetical protein
MIAATEPGRIVQAPGHRGPCHQPHGVGPCRDLRTDPRARFGGGHQPRLSVQTARRGARPADPGPPSAAQRGWSVSLQMVLDRLDRGDRGLGSARRRAVARAAVNRAGGPFRGPRLPRRVRRALLRLSAWTATMDRRDDHSGRARGHRPDWRWRQPPEARLAGGADRRRGRDLRDRRRAREDLDAPPSPAARRRGCSSARPQARCSGSPMSQSSTSPRRRQGRCLGWSAHGH